jgi:hypothetical protein
MMGMEGSGRRARLCRARPLSAALSPRAPARLRAPVARRTGEASSPDGEAGALRDERAREGERLGLRLRLRLLRRLQRVRGHVRLELAVVVLDVEGGLADVD